MNCAWCKKSIQAGEHISGAGYDFCTDVCLLRFYKEELPNFVGHVITDEDIHEIERATGQKRKELYEKITLRMMDGVESSNFMQTIIKASDDAEDDSNKN